MGVKRQIDVALGMRDNCLSIDKSGSDQGATRVGVPQFQPIVIVHYGALHVK